MNFLKADAPLVSILVPLYNHERFVVQCLDSIVQDTYPNLEVLVLDDGSPDTSYDVANAWRARNPVAFSRFELMHQENQGVTRTLNSLVRMARGDYLAILASDDCLLPNGIEERVKALLSTPQWLAVFGDCIVVDEAGTAICDSGVTGFYTRSARKGALLDRRLIGVEIAMRWSVPGPVFMMRKETCDIVGYYNESLVLEDRDFYLRLLTRGALGFVDCPVACYRWHSYNYVKQSQCMELMDSSMAKAELQAAARTKGLLRAALMLQYYKRNNWGRVRARGLSKFKGAVRGKLLRWAWRGVDTLQNARYRWRQAVKALSASTPTGDSAVTRLFF